jgi:outer membrane protein assembly factor BamB
VLVENGRLYTMYRPLGMLSAVRRSQEESIVALDAATGKTIWEHKYPASTEGLDFEYGAGPHSTPLIVGNTLFAASSRKELFALDKHSGRVLWHHDFVKEYGAGSGGRGYSPSPLAYRDTVIMPVGGAGQGLMAFNQKTGAVVWKSPSFVLSPASPIVITVDGEDQIAMFGGEEILGLNAASGAILWRHPAKTSWGLNISTPVWGPENILLYSAAYNLGTGALQLSRSGGQTKVKELWFTNRLRSHIGTIIRLGDYAYAANGDFGPSFITSINVKTGEIGWRDRSFSRSTFLHLRGAGSPTPGEGQLLLLDEDGTLALVTVSPAGIKVLSRAEVMTKTSWTAPTLSGTKLYIRDRKEIKAFDLAP